MTIDSERHGSTEPTALSPISTPPDPSAEAIPLSAMIVLSRAAFGSGISLRGTDPLLPRLSSNFN